MRNCWFAIALLSATAVAVADAQSLDSLPFGTGELLTYNVRAPKFGTIGRAVMAISGPVEVRGIATMLVTFDSHLRVLLMKGSDENRSWLDPRRMTSLRFEKHERRPFSSEDDSVEVFPDLHYWTGTNGATGSTTGDAPLDELSFIYFLRTVTLAPDSIYAFDRHYDKRRIPTTVRFVKRDTLRTPAGEFDTVELEMRSKDGVDFKGEWVLRLWISEDPCRLPVRMESVVPLLGKGVMTLESAVTPTCQSVAASSSRGLAASASLAKKP
jgi:hypothetical protein